MSDDIFSRPPEPSGSDKAPLSRSRRLWRFLFLAILALLSCVIVGSVAVICFINTSYGRHFVEKQVPSLTGGMVDIAGLSGRFPTKISLAHLSLRDKQGVWFAADHVTLRWHPLALLHMRVKIDDVLAQTVSLSRMPVPKKPTRRHRTVLHFHQDICISPSNCVGLTEKRRRHPGQWCADFKPLHVKPTQFGWRDANILVKMQNCPMSSRWLLRGRASGKVRRFAPGHHQF
ncbi:hypothetical protein CGLAMM_11100 [Acetobacteraceae bacterium EV16G]|uniref:hypothetical protein n=1 Tax=Sorlinia euscelidii TaxID=3081148 RepID=UPI002F3964F1